MDFVGLWVCERGSWVCGFMGGVHGFAGSYAFGFGWATVASWSKVDIAIFTAAVSDFRTEKKNVKIKKNNNELNIKLRENKDILKFVSTHNSHRPKLVVGFAAETNNLIEFAKIKLEQKHCDWIIANDVSDKSIGFNSIDNEVSIIQKGNEIEKITKRGKSEIASILVQKILKKFSINENQSLN